MCIDEWVLVIAMYQAYLELMIRLRGVVPGLYARQRDFMLILVSGAYSTLIIVLSSKFVLLLSNIVTDGLVVSVVP